MSGARALEARLRAWRAFREVAHATRSLAAAQALRWSTARDHAVAHARRAHELARHGPSPRPPAAAPLLLAIGTDLGLCGRLNVVVGEAARALARAEPPAEGIVVGARLGDLIGAELRARVVAAPTTVEAALALGEVIAAAALEPPGRPLVIVSAVDASPTGTPRVAVERPPEPERARPPRLTALLGGAAAYGLWAERVSVQARAAAALLNALLVEANVRVATTTRAHEVAERRIAEQERALAKARQEGVTRELLEVLGGRRRGEDGLEDGLGPADEDRRDRRALP